jgi:Cu+-exporting ATPase
MLLGRHFQDRQTERLRFVKDYKRYFPLAVHVKSDDTYKLKSIDQLKIDDVAILYPQEVLPFDGELIDDVATLDYAFITGESQEKNIESGQKTFAGGRVLYRPSLFKVIRKAEESSLKSLWNKNERNEELEERKRFTHKVAQYFTAFLLILATSAFFLQIHSNPAAAWKALTTTLIVACPCAILLSETFTQGNALYLLAQNGISVKNGRVLERLNRVKNIFFDKTGTITNNQNPYTIFQGKGQLTTEEISMLRFTTKNSLHPVSQSIHKYILENYPLIHDAEKLVEIKEIPGMGIEAQFIKHHLRIAHYDAPNHKESGTGVWIDKELIGVFQMEFPIKKGVPEMIHNLQIKYPVSIISGDDYKDFERMHELLGHKDIHFKCTPEMKAEIINKSSGPSAYIGDGLNDIAAFREASVGIALQAKYQRFTPAADVLFPDDHPEQLSNLFQFTKWTEYTVYMSWGISLLYNIIGLGYTLQGQLSPLLAAILMPTSTLSIILFTSVMTRYQFKRIFMTVK